MNMTRKVPAWFGVVIVLLYVAVITGLKFGPEVLDAVRASQQGDLKQAVHPAPVPAKPTAPLARV